MDHSGTRRAAEMKIPALIRFKVASTEKFINPGSSVKVRSEFAE